MTTDQWAREWVRRWDLQQQGYVDDRAEMFETMLQLVRDLEVAPRTAIDLGCGPGTLARLVAEAFPEAHVIAVDADPVLLHLAAGVAGDQVETRRLDLTNPEWADAFEPASIDLVVSSTAMHFLAPVTVAQVVEGIGRILRPGGVFLDADTLPSGDASPRLGTALARARQRYWDGPFPGGEDYQQWWTALRAEDREGLAELFADRDATFPGAAPDMPSLACWTTALADVGFAEIEIVAQRHDKRILAAIR